MTIKRSMNPGFAGIDNDLLLVLEGLGIRRLRDLAALPATVVRDRFGYEGQRAWLLAAGHDSERIEPRAVAPALREMLALGEPIATEQAMAHAVRLLLDRLLARPERAGRAPRSLRVGARLAGGGSWEEHVPLREPSSDRKLLEMVATPRLIALGMCMRKGTRRSSRTARARCCAPRARSGESGGPRPCARCAPRWAGMPRCAWSRSLPRADCRSGASRSPRRKTDV